MIKLSAQPEALVGWMESLAEGTRLRLLRLLERHELGVVELCDVLQAPQSTVSRHLKVLADQGWLHHRRQGTNRLYRMILDELEGPARRLWLLAREQTDDWATVQQDQLRLDRVLEQKQSNGQAFFAGAAGEWDRLRGELYGQEFATQAMLALLPREYVVADLGCGTGIVTAQLAPLVRRVVGVDNSPAMLKAARKRTEEFENVELRRAEVQALPIEDASCDVAMLLLVLTYVADPLVVLKEMARILKRGGRAVIVDLLPHDRDDFRRRMGQGSMGFEPKRVEEIMKEAGFGDRVVRSLPPEAEAKGPAVFLAVGSRE